MKLLDWLLDHLPKCVWQIRWTGLSDHHFEHPLDAPQHQAQSDSLWD